MTESWKRIGRDKGSRFHTAEVFPKDGMPETEIGFHTESGNVLAPRPYASRAELDVNRG
jgi:hypothetical protein